MMRPSTWWADQLGSSKSSRTRLPRIRRCLVLQQPAADLQTESAAWLSVYTTLITSLALAFENSVSSATNSSIDRMQVVNSQMATSSLSAVLIVTKACRWLDQATKPPITKSITACWLHSELGAKLASETPSITAPVEVTRGLRSHTRLVRVEDGCLRESFEVP